MDNSQRPPACIGLIMDGNRRWAKAQGLPTYEGHAKGRDVLKECVRWAKRAGVKNLIFYAFSTENWRRSEDEVSYLMKLLETTLEHDLDDLKEERVRVRFLGERERMPGRTQSLMERWETETERYTEGTIAIALSYGGRSEIIRAVERLHVEGYERGVGEEDIASHLDTAGMPDPDIIIRTGGEKRLSGFLTWQSVYSELFFIDTLWPDLTEADFTRVLTEYKARKRNFGA